MDQLGIKEDIPGCFIPIDIQLLMCKKKTKPATVWFVLARVQTEKQDKCPIFGTFETTVGVLCPV